MKGKAGIRIHEKSLTRFRDKVRTITKRNRRRSAESILGELKRFVVGWLGYYKLASLSSKLRELDGWVRARVRMYLWKQWKRVRTRFRNLQALGIHREQAWMWANTRKGYWRIAHSQVLSMSMSNNFLETLGLVNMSKLYMKVRI